MTENKEIINVQAPDGTKWEEILRKEVSIAPVVDIYETNDEFVMIANMPGISRNDVQLKLEDGSLLIFGRINYKEFLNRKYILNEAEIGHYFRRFRIADSIDESKISAKYENGQLVVSLPKHERIKPRTIDIN